MSNLQPSFWLNWVTLSGIILVAYFTFAGGIYCLLYKNCLLYKKGSDLLALNSNIENEPVKSFTIAEDVKLSILSAVVFGLGIACFITLYSRGLTKVYIQLWPNNIGYLALSYIVVLILQDAYFYFVHRLFHLPMWFRWFHRGHHQSRPPTPWTFFALEPMEAAAQILFLFGITLVIPLHLGIIVAILLTMTVWSMGNHLGFHVIPSSSFSRWWGQWCIGATHHLVHHQQYTKHYGLYFTFWDKRMGTQDRNYEAQFTQPLNFDASTSD